MILDSVPPLYREQGQNLGIRRGWEVGKGGGLSKEKIHERGIYIYLWTLRLTDQLGQEGKVGGKIIGTNPKLSEQRGAPTRSWKGVGGSREELEGRGKEQAQNTNTFIV